MPWEFGDMAHGMQFKPFMFFRQLFILVFAGGISQLASNLPPHKNSGIFGDLLLLRKWCRVVVIPRIACRTWAWELLVLAMIFHWVQEEGDGGHGDDDGELFFKKAVTVRKYIP